MNQQTKTTHKGFTLIELITVVAIVSLLVVYLSIKLSSSNEDARVGMSTTFLVGNVPTAIGAYKARHMSSCKAMDPKDDKKVRQQLLDRGLAGTTPWNADWGAKYFQKERRLVVIFPLEGSENPQEVANSIVSSVYDAPQIEGVTVSAKSTSAPGSVSAIKKNLKDGKVQPVDVPDGVVADGSIQVAYSCN